MSQALAGTNGHRAPRERTALDWLLGVEAPAARPRPPATPTGLLDDDNSGDERYN